MIVYAGSWGKGVSDLLVSAGYEKGNIDISKFKNKEYRVRILDDVKNRKCVVVQSMAPEPNIAFVELLLIIEALKENGAEVVTAIVPFLGYSFQNRHFDGEPISAKVMARALSNSGVDKVEVVDLHEEGVLNFFSIPIENVSASKTFEKYLKNKTEDYVLISPDKGSRKRAHELADMLGVRVVELEKKRNEQNLNIEGLGKLEGDIKDNCIVVDDAVNSGGTMVKVADWLRQHGASHVEWLATHFLGVEESRKKLSSVDKFVTTNSVDHGLKTCGNIEVLDLDIF